uniref:Uncharacterized protein n=1 Tax=Plectus sambesii TaxID=2011161 RepID=A0A914UJV4_9BILA
MRSSPLSRSTTFAGTQAYGYGGGYMSRSLSRSGSTLFGKAQSTLFGTAFNAAASFDRGSTQHAALF